MTIYILDKDPDKCANMLDDKSLDKMIKDIAQVLCDAHYFLSEGDYKKNYITPLPLSDTHLLWAEWVRKARDNYLYLIDMGFSCCTESVFRHGITKDNAKYRDIIRWNYDNMPNIKSYNIIDKLILEDIGIFLPCIMPKKYLWPERAKDDKRLYGFSEIELITRQYKHYYKANLDKQKKPPIWTKRVKPDFLII